MYKIIPMTTNRPQPKNRRNWLLLLIISCLFSLDTLHSQCSGGQIFASNGTENASLCMQDAMAMGLDVYNNSSYAPNYAYVVTDINNQILSFDLDNNLRFENLIEGTYYVYGFAYSGPITSKLGDYVYSSKFANGCWQISHNRIVVKLASPNTSEVRTSDFKTEKFLCLNQGAADFVSFQNTSAKNTPYVFLVTDAFDQIIEVNYSTFADFSNAPTGKCKIYGLAYTGQLLATYGMNISQNLSSGCAQLSDNYITVDRSSVDGGDVYTQDFKSFQTITTDDGLADRFDFTNSGSVQADYTYVVTDVNNTVLSVLEEPNADFEGFDAGTYRIWGFSFSGDVVMQEGYSVFGLFSSGCYQRSFSAVTVTALHEGILQPPAPCAATSTTISSLNETTICKNDDVQTIITDAQMDAESRK